MGGSHSREEIEVSDTESEEEEQKRPGTSDREDVRKLSDIDDAESQLRSLSLKYASASREVSDANLPNTAKLYLHIDGKWVLSDKLVSYSFKKSDSWVLKIGSKTRVRVDPRMQLKSFPEQRRVDFLAAGVWALKFASFDNYVAFYNEYQKCLFENVFGMEATEENKIIIYGRDFMGWAKPELADDTIWEDAEESFENHRDLLKEFEEVVDEGCIQSLALGALENSFLVSNSGIQVVKNFNHGIHGKGVRVKLSNSEIFSPTKALLMKSETNMLVMSPGLDGNPRSEGLQQFDIETGKSMGQWKFEKDGTNIKMKDITNDSKASQLDPSESTFLGLDDNALCRWDMRVRKGMVQTIAKSNDSPVLQWDQGHQFSRGTNFQCFATTGDGSIVVGSFDGRIRLYSKSSMRVAKTVFPGFGLPITHVDVTFDGRWILGTTDSYLVLISAVFKDKDGKEKTGFGGRMGNRIAAPRLLKLTPVDSQLSGEYSKFKGGHFSWVSKTQVPVYEILFIVSGFDG